MANKHPPSAGTKEIVITNRSEERAEKNRRYLQRSKYLGETLGRAALTDHRSHLIVNTTNQGMAGQTPLDLSLELAQPKAIVADIIYVPLKTSLIKDAKSRGLRTVGGLGMLLHKSRPAWKLWFGIDPEITESLCSIMEKKYQRERLISPASRPQ